MAKAKMLVLATATAGQREELDRWYNERHIPDLLKVPGFHAATRYHVRTMKWPKDLGSPDFLGIYELEGDDIDVVLGEMVARMGTPEMPTSPALDSSKTIALIATPKDSE